MPRSLPNGEASLAQQAIAAFNRGDVELADRITREMSSPPEGLAILEARINEAWGNAVLMRTAPDLGESLVHIPNWDEYQHYNEAKRKGRPPVWLKLYTNLHDKPAYMNLSVSERGLLHELWILRARTGADISVSSLRRFLGLSRSEARRLSGWLGSLEDAGFIHTTKHERSTNEAQTKHERSTPTSSNHAGLRLIQSRQEVEVEVDTPLTPLEGGLGT